MISAFHPYKTLPWEYTIRQQREYANRHGYVFCRCTGVLNPRRERIEFSKVTLVGEMLKLFGMVVWVDQDIGIINCSQSLEETFRIKEYPNVDSYWVQDLNPDVINTGFFMIRQTNWSIHFIKEWDQYYSRLPRLFNWLDQTSLVWYRTFYPQMLRNYTQTGEHGKILERRPIWAVDWDPWEKQTFFAIHFLGFTPRELKVNRTYEWFNGTDRSCQRQKEVNVV